jgi:hypothetical protein
MTWFINRKLLIATQHGKEKVIAPLMEQTFSFFCELPNTIDTDQFGTFSGEIERKLNPLETARLKGVEAAQHNDADLVISSEGSFGPHPQLYFLPYNQELLLFQDLKNGFEIHVIESSTNTNFASETISTENELEHFAKRIGFPEHGIILKDRAEAFKTCIKGIRDAEALVKSFQLIRSEHGSVHAETDMRAHFNPTRMLVIKQACEKLVERMQQCCVQCGLPGFGQIAFTPGLPCSWCGLPTHLPLRKELSCPHCSFGKVETMETGLGADPMHCSQCNP